MTNHDDRGGSIRSVRRSPPDFRQLGRAFLELARSGDNNKKNENNKKNDGVGRDGHGSRTAPGAATEVTAGSAIVPLADDGGGDEHEDVTGHDDQELDDGVALSEVVDPDDLDGGGE